MVSAESAGVVASAVFNVNRTDNRICFYLRTATAGHVVDVVILSDLKRMSERGVLIIETTQPDFEQVYMDKSISLRATVHTRLRFIGEETILDQRELIKKLKKQVVDQQLTIDVLKAEHDDSE